MCGKRAEHICVDNFIEIFDNILKSQDVMKKGNMGGLAKDLKVG